MSTSKTFRLFISSTFGDFRREREVLQTKVFPHIRTYCSQRGFSFQPIDLRWGVSAEAQLDQKTLQLCLEEVSACKTYPHPNFLIMAGDRYGWVSLPYAIKKEEFKTLRDLIIKDNKSIHLEYKKYNHYPDPTNRDDYETRQKATRTTSDLELLDQWYSLDDNQLTPSYILKEREKDGEYEIYENWEAEEGALRTILQSAVNSSTLTEEQKRKYFLSATEAEVEEGIIPYLRETEKQQKLLKNHPELKEIDPQHIFGFFRDIDKSTQIEKKFIENDQDYEKAQAFKIRMAKVLKGKRNTLHSEIKQIDKDKLDEAYLAEFEKRMKKFLESSVKKYVEQSRNDNFSELDIETDAQRYFAEQKRENFLETKPLEELLNTISTYIAETSPPSSPLVIYGPSGRGKSSLMAQAINQTENALTHKVLYRFVGATPNSGRSTEILSSIFEELGIEVCSVDDKETFEQFSYRIHDQIMQLKDITIFIDAVDQLGNDDQFLWLPRTLPSNVKIIISALEDENYSEDSKYFKTLQQKTTNLHAIPEFNDPITLLRNILSNEQRTLKEHQETYFLKQFLSSPSPLYITIAAQEMKHWKSNDRVAKGGNPKDADGKIQALASTQKGIIDEFISNLKKLYHHNEEFVHKVLGYLYASRDGLSESELLQLLKSDESFIQKMAPETWHENPTKELPMVHWSRLYTQLKPFLSIKRQDNEELMYFFHREFESLFQQKFTRMTKINARREHEELLISTLKLLRESINSTVLNQKYVNRAVYYYLLYEDDEKLKQFAYEYAKNKQWFDFYEVLGSKSRYSKDEEVVRQKFRSFFAQYFYETADCLSDDRISGQNIYCMSLTHLSGALKDAGKLDEATKLDVKVYDIKKEAFCEERPKDFVESANNVATSMLRNGDYFGAIKTLEEILYLAEKVIQIGQRDGQLIYATILTNLAYAYLKLDISNTDHSIVLFEQARDLAQEYYSGMLQRGDNRGLKNYLVILNHLAKVYSNCVTTYEKAIETATLALTTEFRFSEHNILELLIQTSEILAILYVEIPKDIRIKGNNFELALAVASMAMKKIKNDVLADDNYYFLESKMSLQYLITKCKYELEHEDADESWQEFNRLIGENNLEHSSQIVSFLQKLNNYRIPNYQHNQLSFLQELTKKDMIARTEHVKALFLYEDDEIDFQEILKKFNFSDNVPYEHIKIRSEYRQGAEFILGVDLTIPCLIYYLEGDIEEVFSINDKHMTVATLVEMLSENNEDGSFADLLYLAKVLAYGYETEKIEPMHFFLSIGFIELNDIGKHIFSQIMDIDQIEPLEEAQRYIEIAKELPKMLYSEELKGLIEELKTVFGDEPIGNLR